LPVIPGSSSSADDAADGGDRYPAGEASIRRPASRPIADLLARPIAIVAVIGVAFIGFALLVACWVGSVLLAGH
jgi:hypothetical protein